MPVDFSAQPTEQLLDEGDNGRLQAPAFPPNNRVKNLPTPPVGPVLPDFDDLMVSRKASRSPVPPTAGSGSGGAGAGGAEEGGVKRKPSVVKKLRDRMVK
jgi:hypothetical protein